VKTAIGKEAGGVTNRWQEQLGYAYDAAGNLNTRTNNALIQSFGANNLNELTAITRSGTFTVTGTTTSPATNVTVNTTNAFLYADTTFAATNFTLANGNNTFIAIAKDSYGRKDTNSITVNLPTTDNFAYDLNGNMLTNNLQVLDYDDENELIRVTVTNSFKKEYVYDGMRRLRIRKEFGWTGSAWTQTNEIHYIYDGNVIVQLRDTNNLPMLTFTRGLDLSGSLQGAGGTGGLLAMTENSSSTHSYYHADGNGNITMLINSYQLPVGKYGYDSFGNPLWESGTKAFVNPIWYSSQLYDPDTGFLQYLYRIYIPELDRWLNEDPIGEFGGLNLYAYIANNPVNLTGSGDWLGIMAYSFCHLSTIEFQSQSSQTPSKLLSGYLRKPKHEYADKADAARLWQIRGLSVDLKHKTSSLCQPETTIQSHR
jgi:RHS repeat-associated protein